LFLGDTGVHIVGDIMCQTVLCDRVEEMVAWSASVFGIAIAIESARHDRDALFSLIWESFVAKSVAMPLSWRFSDCSNPVPLADEVASLLREYEERISRLEARVAELTRESDASGSFRECDVEDEVMAE
jgi:hypothetical protein